jgi:hypothetical protein
VTCGGLLVMASAAVAEHPPWVRGAGAHLEGLWIYEPIRAEIPDAAWADVTVPAAGARSDYGADWTGGLWWNTYIIHGPPLPYVDLELHCTLNGWMSGYVASPGEEIAVSVRVAAAAGEPGDWGEAVLLAYVTETGPFYEYRENGALQGLGQWDGVGIVTFNQASVVLVLSGLPVGEPFVLDQELGTATGVEGTTTAGTNFVDTFRLEQFVLPPGYSITAVPEPSMLALLMCAAIGIVALTRPRWSERKSRPARRPLMTHPVQL